MFVNMRDLKQIETEPPFELCEDLDMCTAGVRGICRARDHAYTTSRDCISSKSTEVTAKHPATQVRRRVAGYTVYRN